MLKPPNKIYLQIAEDGDDYDLPEGVFWSEGVTWCVDRINDDDAEYVLASSV